MPKLVDHDLRREEIAASVLRVVARDGVRGVTMRDIAAEAGWSTGVLNHYFDNKQELLVGGLRLAAREVGENVSRAMRERTGRDQLRAVLQEGMPLDARRRATCRIFFSFWAEGGSDPDLAAELAAYYDWWRTRIRQAIERGQSDGWIIEFESQKLAEMLLAMADGLSVQATFSKRVMSRKRQRDHIEEWINFIGPARNEQTRSCQHA